MVIEDSKQRLACQSMKKKPKAYIGNVQLLIYNSVQRTIDFDLQT